MTEIDAIIGNNNIDASIQENSINASINENVINAIITQSVINAEIIQNVINVTMTGGGASNIENGTVAGQLTYWNGTKWTYIDETLVSFVENILFAKTLKTNDIIRTSSGTITRDENGFIESIELDSGRTINLTRDANDFISEITDGINTWTVARDENNFISSFTYST